MLHKPTANIAKEPIGFIYFLNWMEFIVPVSFILHVQKIAIPWRVQSVDCKKMTV